MQVEINGRVIEIEQRDGKFVKPDILKRLDGYNCALKPAWEPVIVAMKPLDGTYAQNALAWGVAGINVDGARVGTEDDTRREKGGWQSNGYVGGEYDSEKYNALEARSQSGRWPANLVHDGSDEVLAGFPMTTSGARNGGEPMKKGRFEGEKGAWGLQIGGTCEGSTGSAARFFYCAKASKAERDAGCDGLEERHRENIQQRKNNGSGGLLNGTGTVLPMRNPHPCVKPLALTEYLARLILPPQRETPRRLLVPFCGSGSEMIGALKTGWDEVIGIELDPEYVAIAEARLAHHCGQHIQHPLFQAVGVNA